MNFNEFKKQIVKEIRNYLPKEYQTAKISTSEVIKTNTVLTSLVIVREEENTAPNIYLDGYFEAYEDGYRELGEILERIASVRVDLGNQAFPYELSDLPDIFNWEEVKSLVRAKITSQEGNERLMAERPHKRFLDFVISYYVIVMGDTEGTASVSVTNEMLARWQNVSVDKLHEVAMKNSKDAVYEFFEVCPGMFCATNKNKLFGAITLAEIELLKEIKQRIGNYYILPSSVHELLIVPTYSIEEDIQDYEEYLRSTIKAVNDNEVSLEERLSYNLYKYDGELSIA